jgi:hypothetical protein
MKTTNIKHLCALLMTALAFAACSSDADDITNLPEPQQPAADGIRFTAVFGVKNAGTTRALSDPGDGTLTASWVEGEEIAIVFGDSKYIARVTHVDATTGSATVVATLPSTTPNNQAVTFVYPASAADGSGLRSNLLAAQDGTFATLSSQFDVATATGTIVIDGTEGYPNGTVTLENQYAICKLQFKDDNNEAIIDITRVSITDLSTTEVVCVNTPSAQSAVYVALKPTTNTVKFIVQRSNGDVYKKVSNSNLQAGKFYHPTLTAAYDAEATSLSIPLTLEAIASGTVSFTNKAAGSVYYSINGGPRTEITAGETGTTPTLSAGQKVVFYGNNATYETSLGESKFYCSADCYIYGNIMSLISSSDFPDCKALTEKNTFCGLFSGNEHIKSHSSKPLLLPATRLADYCYESLFKSCTGLTTAPDLPATTLKSYCYKDMFDGCTGLTTAPNLPATTLAEGCYKGMFMRCTNLTTAPDLPATTLKSYCYIEMFSGCTSLTTAPDLPATTLTSGCYALMFCGCTNLNSIKCLATDIHASCTNDWIKGVATSGTFTKAASADWSVKTGNDGIPSGWTVVDE